VNRLSAGVHCKNYPYIHGYFVASFPYFTYTFVSTTQCLLARASLFRRFTDTNVYGTGSVKIRKTRRKISVDIGICLTGRSVETTPAGRSVSHCQSLSHQVPRPVDGVEDEEHQRKEGARDDLDHDRLVAGELLPPGRQPVGHSQSHAGDRHRRLDAGARRRRTASAAAAAALTPAAAAVRLHRRRRVDGQPTN